MVKNLLPWQFIVGFQH